MEFNVSTNIVYASELHGAYHSFWRLWQSLPRTAEPDFFADAKTLECWTQSLPPKQKLVISLLMEKCGRVVGVALFGMKTSRIKRFFTVTSLSLLRSGSPQSDQWWPEYVQPRCEARHVQSIGWWLTDTARAVGATQWETMVIPKSWLIDWVRTAPSGIRVISHSDEPGGRVDLSVPSLWRPSVLRQCRQTERYAEKTWSTPLFLEEVDPKNKVAALSSFAHWHIDKWSQSNTLSGFKNGRFVTMLKLLAESHDGFRVFLLRAGDRCVGMHIVLQKEGWAGFYLSSLLPQSSNQWRPGIWLHVAVAERLRQEGVQCYDLMAGDAPYKQQLATDTPIYTKGLWFDTYTWQGKAIYALNKLSLDGNIIK